MPNDALLTFVMQSINMLTVIMLDCCYPDFHYESSK
jgi:hypothetical protein